jgi:hypothetical protein
LLMNDFSLHLRVPDDGIMFVHKFHHQKVKN